MPRLLFVLVVCALVAMTAGRAEAQLLSPGPLSAAHASIDGDDHCNECHQSGKQVVASRCLACHQDLRARLDAGAGLHGKQYKGQACENCHVEHIGRKAKLVRWPGGSPDKLDHDLTGWPLAGKHQPVGCAKCHTKQSPLGKTQYVGTKATCASCHKDPHANRFGSDCKKCHDERAWGEFAKDKFDHAQARYPLTGKHVPVPCEKCHGTPAKWTGIAFGACDDCHDDPHAGEFKPKACAACHQTSGWESASDLMRDQHPWLSLRNGHARVGCKKCHDRGNDKAPSKGNTCVDCHKAVHEAPFGNRCDGCHKTIKWLGLPEQIGRDAHPKTAYPLEGKHQQVRCASCHPKDKPAAARYRQLTFDRCAACHADRHAGEFAARAAGECAACHTVGGFAPTTFGPSQHATTAFALDGRHAATPCAGCHTAPRPRLDWKQPKRACAECHANPHGDQFAKELAAGGCASCHATDDWDQPRIDHSTWPLTGKHATTACARCHGETKGAEAAAFRGVPRTCDGCHDDVHGGQFRLSDPVRRCEDCHTTAQFQLPGFDHAAMTTYRLAGKHAAVACATCHQPSELRNGVTATRYRLGYRACKDCHANPHREDAR